MTINKTRVTSYTSVKRGFKKESVARKLIKVIKKKAALIKVYSILILYYY
jgi:hypothetical protein